MDATSEFVWQSVALLYDETAAHNLAALLEAEAVPTQVVPDSKLIGYTLGWEVRVPPAMLQRAQELLAPSRFTDAELASRRSVAYAIFIERRDAEIIGSGDMLEIVFGPWRRGELSCGFSVPHGRTITLSDLRSFMSR